MPFWNAVMRAELFRSAALVFHCDFSMSASGFFEKHGCTWSERLLPALGDIDISA
jgi:hypothetical protein